MPNFFSRSLRSMLGLLRSFRTRKEQPVSPNVSKLGMEQFQKMLAATLADPDFKLMLLKSMAGTVWPIQGGMACSHSLAVTVDSTLLTAGKLARFLGTTDCTVGNSAVYDDGSRGFVRIFTPQTREW